MRSVTTTRILFAATSAIVTAGLVLQLAISVTSDTGSELFASTPDRIVNFFSFFTVLSNVAVAVTIGLLAVNPTRRSTLFRVLRLDGVVAIAVTGVVFHLTLAQLRELTGWNAVADFILHTLSPTLGVVGWLVLGPSLQITTRVVRLSVIAPVIWLGYALVRGTLVQDRFGNDYYAYPFINVQEHGYPVVLVNVALVAGLFLALSFGAMALDTRLGQVRGAAASDQPT